MPGRAVPMPIPMSPLPEPGPRAAEYAAKGVHAGLREIGQAPEQVRARSLAREAAALPPAPTAAASRSSRRATGPSTCSGRR